MTQSEEIIRAVAELAKQGRTEFSRKEIRNQIGIGSKKWKNSYSPTFQGMRDDHPGGAPKVAKQFADVLHRVRYGRYIFSPKGKRLIKKFDC